jgi:hypothetical protein
MATTEAKDSASPNELFLRRWGPYVSNRQWGTVREMYNLGPYNYETDGNEGWRNLSYDESGKTAYQFGEDGIFGISDEDQYLCFALAFWNHNDKEIKERFYGLPGLFGNPEGHLGEDIKELFYYLDNTPDHSYMRALYKYPFNFPYEELKQGNATHGKLALPNEFEILETGAFASERYFDIYVEYAKDNDTGSICIHIHVQNRSQTESEITILPTLWFRNVWEWGRKTKKPLIKPYAPKTQLVLSHTPCLQADYLPDTRDYPKSCYLWAAASDGGRPTVLLTDNQTNPSVYQQSYERREDNVLKATYWQHVHTDFIKEYSPQSCYKDLISQAIVHGQPMGDDVTSEHQTKSALVFRRKLQAKESYDIYLRLGIDFNEQNFSKVNTISSCESVISRQRKNSSKHHPIPENSHPVQIDSEEEAIYRQAIATLLWNKQFYHFNHSKWSFYRQLFVDQLVKDKSATKDIHKIDPHQPRNNPDATIKITLNSDWQHMASGKIMVMPDKWEYPYFCTWDTAFHAITMALVDREMAKELLRQLVDSDCMHPNGKMPGCEFEFSDVHPPIHAWAVMKVATSSAKDQQKVSHDLDFLEEMIWKLWRHFVWWTTEQRMLRHHYNSSQNKEVEDINHFYKGGFLGLDNIAVVDRNHFTSGKVTIEQVDSAAWVAFFALSMLKILVALSDNSVVNESYLRMADQCLKTFLSVEKTLNQISSQEYLASWDMQDYWYYDIMRIELESFKMDLPMQVRSLVGMIPLLATEIIIGKLENPVIKLIEKTYREQSAGTSQDHFFDVADFPFELKPSTHNPLVMKYDKDQYKTFEFSIVNQKKLCSMLDRILSDDEFLSPYGIRSLSKYHQDHPFSLKGLLENKYGANFPIHIAYEPGRSLSKVFGSVNSNWRGPIWVQMNYMLIDMLRTRSMFCRESEVNRPLPTFSENRKTYYEISKELTTRIINLFKCQQNNQNNNDLILYRPCHGQSEQSIQFYKRTDHEGPSGASNDQSSSCPLVKESDLILFYEFFHAELGTGLGANHQSWTTIVANLIAQQIEDQVHERTEQMI